MAMMSESMGGNSGQSQWLLVDAKSRYSQACGKLGLDSQKVQGRHLTNYSFEDLSNEKKRVKNELKLYDQEFIKRFGRPPSRVEKEPMRNLYMYYKRLKQYLSRRQGQAARSASAAAGTPAATQQNNPVN